jgi:hypothetical protein
MTQGYSLMTKPANDQRASFASERPYQRTIWKYPDVWYLGL